MANLKDLENHLRTIAEAEKNGGILDIPTEAIQILAMCNSIRIEMINEMCEGLDPEQCDEQLFIQLVSGCYLDIDEQNTALTAIAHAKKKTHASQPGYERLEKLERKLEEATKAYFNNR